MKAWLWKLFKQPFSIVCDNSPFRSSWGFHERVFQRKGLLRARRCARRWVAGHSFGQARVYSEILEDERG